MNHKLNVLFPVETIARELDFRLFLAALFARPDRRIFIGLHDLLAELSAEARGGIWVGKNVFSIFSVTSFERYRALKERGYRIVHLDEEGAVSVGGEKEWADELLWRLDVRKLDDDDLVCTWGRFQADFHRTRDPARGARVRVTGHPRFDLYKPRFRAFYETEAAELRRRFGGPFVLVNTNLAWANNGAGVADTFDERHGPDPAVHADRVLLIERWEHSARVLSGILQLTSRLAVELPDVKIVVRPHPSEGQELYKTLFKKAPNVVVLHEGPVSPWLFASGVMIHDGCTTALEASLADRWVLTYKPFVNEAQEFPLPNLFGQRCTTQDEALAFAREALAANGASWPSRTPHEDARRLMYNFEGDSFEALLAVMEEAAASVAPLPFSASRLEARRLSFDGYAKARGLVRPLFPKKAAAYRYARNKFPGFDAEAVKRKMVTIARIVGKELDVRFHGENLMTVETR